MRYLYRYGKIVEWICAGISVVSMLLLNLGILDGRWAKGLAIIFFIIYWGLILPRLVHEHQSLK